MNRLDGLPKKFKHKKCERCGDEFIPRSSKNKCCEPCRPIAKREYQHQYVKGRYQKLVKAGMCPSHCDTPVLPGKTVCQKCVDHTADYRVKRFVTLTHAGMCHRHAHEPVVPGYKLCAVCLRNSKIVRYLSAPGCTLTSNEINNKINQPCFYCGAPAPVWGHGLDRVDVTKPYTLLNTVSCCWTQKDGSNGCNRIKNSCTITIAQQMIEYQLEICDEATMGWFNKLTAKIPNPTFVPQSSYAQLSLDGGHFL